MQVTTSLSEIHHSQSTVFEEGNKEEMGGLPGQNKNFNANLPGLLEE